VTAAKDPPRTPLRSLQHYPRSLADFKGPQQWEGEEREREERERAREGEGRRETGSGRGEKLEQGCQLAKAGPACQTGTERETKSKVLRYWYCCLELYQI